MIQRIISSAILLFLLVSCEKRPDMKEFPIITTLNPINIDETGATFRGELVKEGMNKIISYGFIWSIQEPNIKTSEKIVVGYGLSEGNFETRINYSLAKGFEYKIRSFATYGIKTVYGNTISLLSKGCEKTIWAKELSGVKLDGWGTTPNGWSDGVNGYVIFQNARVHRFDPTKMLFSQLADFPVSGNSGTCFTTIGIDNIEYVLSSINKNLYKLEGGIWSVKSNAPYNNDYFCEYDHGYTTLNQIFLLSSVQSFSYNLATNLWQNRSAMPSTSYPISGTDLNGFSYVIDCRKNILRYNPQDNSWQNITTFPGIFPAGSVNFGLFEGKMIAFSHDKSIYFGFSSFANSSERVKSIWGFNLITNTWKEIETFPDDIDKGEIFYFNLKGKLYIGHENSGAFSIYSLDTSKL